MKRILTIIILVLAGYALGWSASVWRFGLPSLPFTGDHRGPRGPDGMFDSIGLSEDQKTAIKSIRAQEFTAKESLGKELAEARRKFESTLDTTQDQELLKRAFEEMLAVKNSTDRAHFENMMRIHQILTMDQIKKLGEERPKNRGPKGRPPRERGPGPGEGPDGGDGPPF